jgi:hypothetical protein
MLWEAKSTKAWNHKWVAKLRRDQQAAKAEIGLIASNALPPNIETFDRIWQRLGHKQAVCNSAGDSIAPFIV